MKEEALAVVACLAMLTLLVPIGGESPIQASGHTRAMSTPQLIQTDALAYRTGSLKGTFWQNGSFVYSTGSAIAPIPTTLTPVVPNTVYNFHLTAVPSFGANTGSNPQIGVYNFTQGSTTLANLTIPGYYTLTPLPGPTPVKTKVPAAFENSGSVAGVASYPFWVNYSIEATYLQTSTPIWSLRNGSTENLSYPLVLPSGYQLNKTFVTVPLPVGVNANATTLSVTQKTGAAWRNLSTYYLAGGAVVVLIPGANSNTTIHLNYTAQGATVGGTPVLTLGKVYQLASGLWQGNASWVNPSSIPWSGEILIQTNGTVAGSIVPQSLNVTANHLYLRNNSFTIAGNAVVILPGSLTVWGGRVMVFQVRFAETGVAPNVPLCLSCGVAGSSVTWLDLALVTEFVLAMATLVRATQIRGRRIATSGYGWTWSHGDHLFWSTVYLFLFIALVVVIADLVGAG